MSLVLHLEEYVPSNEEEIKDKEVILKYINIFDDILKRENEIIHFTASGFVINKERDKVLMVHHNIFDAWSLTGGHADGDENLLKVALKEVREETGVCKLSPITRDIFSLDLLAVCGHYRRGKYVSPHLHASVVYLIYGDECEELFVKPDENSAVKWIPLNEIEKYSNEPHMIKIYNKIITKIKKIKV